jgi:hypothetical protein
MAHKSKELYVRNKDSLSHNVFSIFLVPGKRYKQIEKVHLHGPVC